MDTPADPRPPQFNDSTLDEGGLRAPPNLSRWGKAWWWFDFVILVKLARLRLGDAGERSLLEFVGVRDREVQKSPKPKFEDAAEPVAAK